MPGMFPCWSPLLILWVSLIHSNIGLSQEIETPSQIHLQQAVVRPNALRNFEVREPPVVPKSKPCHLVILTHTFENSYGRPATADFDPPSQCGPVGSWGSVIFNMTTTSIGTQYDRLGRLYFRDVEIWRTSTAEPTKQGIIWSVTRDMTKYVPLLSSPGTFSLDLGNIVDPALNLTGAFEVTLSAKFYPPTPEFPASKTVDKIINIGQGVGNNVTNFITFPQNLKSAFVELFASGSRQEEFWYTNAPDEYIDKLDPSKTGNVAVGKGPFREVQLWIDGVLAGVAYPFPVIYTGGILLTWWRPIAAIGAFDAPTYMIDISPFIPHLTDSSPHNITLIVVGEGTQSSINPEWLLSGSVFANLDPSGARTTGKMLQHFTESKTVVEPSSQNLIKAENIAHGANTPPINFIVKSYRKLSISSTLTTGSGNSQIVKFKQDLVYTNQQSWIPGGDYQAVLLSSQGSSFSYHENQPQLIDRFEFPLNLSLSNIAVPSPKSFKTVGQLDHAFKRTQYCSVSSSLGQIKIDTKQTSTGELHLNSEGRASGGFGKTGQLFHYEDGRGETYDRDVEVFNATQVLRDRESGSLAPPKISSTDGVIEISTQAVGLHESPCRPVRVGLYSSKTRTMKPYPSE